MMLIFHKIRNKKMTKKTKKYKGWSKTQYGSMLSEEQHQANDDWFDEKLKIAKSVCVSELGMCWDRDMNKTEMIVSGNYDFIFADMVGTVGATTMSSFDELMEKLQDKSNECLDELQDKSNDLENELEDRIENNIDDKLDYIKEETIEHIIDLLRS
jgi:hypothetical protein